MEFIDKVHIIYRATPRNRLIFIAGLKYYESKTVGLVVDGVADIDGLRAADIGISMGLSGQNLNLSSKEQSNSYLHGSVMREKAGIVIMDDNFKSVFNAARWGRNIFDNCRKFIQF